MTHLNKKTAFITGATSGIGKSTAIALAKKGCNLVCVGRNYKNYESLKNEITNNISLYFYKCDITNEHEINELIKRIYSEFINIDILIHSAGYAKSGSIFNSTIEEYNTHFNINVRAPYLITKLLLPKLIEKKGQIVFINSSATQRIISNMGLYSASKLALKGLANCLRKEVNNSEVKILSIYPGKTDTPMQKELQQNANKKYDPKKLIQPVNIASIIVSALELSDNSELTDIYIRPFHK